MFSLWQINKSRRTGGAEALIPPTSNGHSYVTDILGGVSEEQWQAFNIEQFSNCRLPSTSVPATNYAEPKSGKKIGVDRNATSSNGKPDGNGLLDIDKILDTELIRILINYEADKSPRDRMMAGQEQKDFSGLIGRRLQMDSTASQNKDLARDKGQNDTKEDGSGDFAKKNHDDWPELEPAGGSIKETVALSRNDEKWKQVKSSQDMYELVRQNENWPLLKDIIQPGTSQQSSSTNVFNCMGHGRGRGKFN